MKMDESLGDKKIGIVSGGFDGERDVSLISGKNIYNHLQKRGLNIASLDMRDDFLDQLNQEKVDILYNALHGQFGEDGRFQGMMDFLKIPYTGEFFFTHSLFFDKKVTKQLFIQAGIQTPDFISLPEIKGPIDRKKKDIHKKMAFPYMLKKSKSGSSVGVYLIEEEKDLDKVLESMVDGNDYYLEKYISGREVTVGVYYYLGEPRVLPILEIKPKNKFYDFEAKYTKGMTVFEIPAQLDKVVEKKIREQCLSFFKKMNFRECVRMDILINQEDIYFIEVNTSPGMTDLSDIPMMLKEQNVDIGDFLIHNLYHAQYHRLS